MTRSAPRVYKLSNTTISSPSASPHTHALYPLKPAPTPSFGRCIHPCLTPPFSRLVRQRHDKRHLLPSSRVLLALVVLLIKTDAQCSNESHVYSWCYLHTVSLLAEEYVFAAKNLAVDTGDYQT